METCLLVPGGVHGHEGGFWDVRCASVHADPTVNFWLMTSTFCLHKKNFHVFFENRFYNSVLNTIV